MTAGEGQLMLCSEQSHKDETLLTSKRRPHFKIHTHKCLRKKEIRSWVPRGPQQQIAALWQVYACNGEEFFNEFRVFMPISFN
jgi:hypothetical protein